MKKEIYIDLMEKVMSAYTLEHIHSYTQSVREGGLKEHGYPRLVANLGVLIAHGRKNGLKDEFRKMMDLCCGEILTAYGRNGFGVGNDFSVKEIVFCILELEKSGVFAKEITNGWRDILAKIDPYKTYSCIAPVPAEPKMNWAAFSGTSEQVRKYAGIGDESAFIDNQIKSQLFAFDENGMYRDPNEPMVYDFVTRLQLAVALYFGYDGENRAELEEQMMKSADITLDMQSVTGEIPFGGRSNQFWHNEGFYAALCEYYASVFYRNGDLVRAGKFKNAARLASEHVMDGLNKDKLSHIKNCYDPFSMFGCEKYAYFDKYMVTAASWFYHAYVMATDGIDEIDCPAAVENVICETSQHFHKVMCRFGDYFVEYDANADYHYDASGLGRIHKRGAPSPLCLSVPFSEHPNYVIDITNPSPLSICAGIRCADICEYTCAEAAKHRLIGKEITDEYIQIVFECLTASGAVLKETCTVSDAGVEISVAGEGRVEVLFPVFEYDGQNSTEIAVTKELVNVLYKGHRCIYSTDGIFEDKNAVYANRNGHYRALCAVGDRCVSLKIKII